MFKKAYLSTGLAPDALRRALARLISDGRKSAFQGKTGKDGFEVRRVNVYSSTYLPFVKGRILERPEGAGLELLFRPHRQVLLFLSIWLTFLLLASLLIILSSRTAGSSRLLLLAAPLSLAALSLLLAGRVFATDCRWVRKALEEHLEAEET